MPGGGAEEEIKIILDGGIAARVLDETCSSIYDFVEKGNKFPDGLRLVNMINEIENKVFEFAKEQLKQQGYVGPFPKCMS